MGTEPDSSVQTTAFRVAVGDVVVRGIAGPRAGDVDHYTAHAALVARLGAPDGESCCVHVSRVNARWPFIVIVLEGMSTRSPFRPGGVLSRPDVDRLFVGAGEHLAAYDLATPKRLWARHDDVARHGRAAVDHARRAALGLQGEGRAGRARRDGHQEGVPDTRPRLSDHLPPTRESHRRGRRGRRGAKKLEHAGHRGPIELRLRLRGAPVPPVWRDCCRGRSSLDRSANADIAQTCAAAARRGESRRVPADLRNAGYLPTRESGRAGPVRVVETWSCTRCAMGSLWALLTIHGGVLTAVEPVELTEATLKTADYVTSDALHLALMEPPDEIARLRALAPSELMHDLVRLDVLALRGC